jgi:hypothetical protein
MKKITKHIKLDYSKRPNEFFCENCGGRRELHLPALIDDVVKQGEAFAESHRYCKNQKPETRNQKL